MRDLLGAVVGGGVVGAPMRAFVPQHLLVGAARAWNVSSVPEVPGGAAGTSDGRCPGPLRINRKRTQKQSRRGWPAAPILTSRRTCCLGAPIALLWRFRELTEDLDS